MNPDDISLKINDLAIEQARLVTRVDALCIQWQETKTLVESVNKLALSIERLTNAQNNTSNQVKKLRTDVDEIQQKPGKKWDTVQTVIITAILSGLIGFAIKSIFG